MTRPRCLVAVFGVTVLAGLLLDLNVDATSQHRRNVPGLGGEMAAPKYDSGGYQSSGYGGSGYSGGGGYSSGGGGYSGGGGGYGGGGYGGGGGGGYDEQDVGGEVKQEHDIDVAKKQTSGGGQTHDTGNVYYYYYPTQTKDDDASSSYPSYNSYPPPPAAYPMYYPMNDDKDKDDGGLLGGLGLGLGIPAILAVILGIPLLLVGLLIAGGALAFFIGRNNDGGYLLSAALKDNDGSPHVPGSALIDLSLVRAVHEAFAAYQALSTDESCRQRVVCELGYILKASENVKGTIISALDSVLPTSFQPQFKPLKEVLLSGESGKCQKYVCDAAATAFQQGPLKTILANRQKGQKQPFAKTPNLDSSGTATSTPRPISSTDNSVDVTTSEH